MSDFYSSNINGYGSRVLDERSKRYVEKYWLSIDGLMRGWVGALNKRFNTEAQDSAVVKGAVSHLRPGGVLFEKRDFIEFTSLSIASGAKEFSVVEFIGQKRWGEGGRAFFRFVYPLDVSWADMVRSSPIADDVFMRPIREYFVISDNASVGKYVNNDADSPYELVFCDF
ncbi:hypothetical protein [Stenotrophomonas sp.]|uniref:hypothetical protein n=1 Tax=Stenotrophomonas sp. TaxID=69392 RepID=UPI00289A71A2|nr:hypothetical protein [Stenotrophomonas sp.]